MKKSKSEKGLSEKAKIRIRKIGKLALFIFIALIISFIILFMIDKLIVSKLFI